MSSFLANIQLRTEDRMAVADAVRVALRRAGFRLEAEQFAGDRSIYVGPADGDWVAVFDSVSDGVTVGPLAWLTQALSAHLACPALAWLVHDRALLYLLFDRGDVVDRYLSDASVFRADGAPGAPAISAPLGGNGDLLLTTCQVAADDMLVSRWLASPEPLPQITLGKIAAVLGQPFADLGHDDIEAEDLASEPDARDTGFTRLEFIRDDGHQRP